MLDLDSRILENLLILFFLLPCMLGTFWGFVLLINKSTGVSLKNVLETIYANPIAAVIYRGALLFSLAQLVIAAYNRIV